MAEEYVICNKTDLVAIADAVRTKTGSAGTLTVDELPTAIAEMESGGGYTIPNDRLAKVTIYVTENVNNYLYGTIFDQDGNVISTTESIVNGATYWVDSYAYYVIESYPSTFYDFCSVSIEQIAGDGHFSSSIMGEVSVLGFAGESTIQITTEANGGWGDWG